MVLPLINMGDRLGMLSSDRSPSRETHEFNSFNSLSPATLFEARRVENRIVARTTFSCGVRRFTRSSVLLLGRQFRAPYNSNRQRKGGSRAIGGVHLQNKSRGRVPKDFPHDNLVRRYGTAVLKTVRA